MSVDKNKIKYLITGYLDGELSESDTKEVEELLKTSSEFKELLKFEEELKHLISRRVKKEKAPTALGIRIRRQINRENGRPGLIELLRVFFEYRPISSSFALAVITILILLPNLSFFSITKAVQQTRLKGEIVCLDCDIFSKHIKVPVHSNLVHRAGIKSEDGSVWTIIQDTSRDNVDMTFLRKKIELTGLIFNELKYIKVNEYQLL